MNGYIITFRTADSLTRPWFLGFCFYLQGDPIFFIGQSGTGATFHKHMPAWNGVVYGQKRWFLYPIEKTPPGGKAAGLSFVPRNFNWSFAQRVIIIVSFL